ncbi:MAG: Crp/Fnr family transcriptional regulator [Oscillospiraceae bacterium]|jgi:CRP/FNR family transcriptional regulator
MNKSEMVEVLSRYFESWPHLSPEEQEGLLQNTRFMTFEKGAAIHNGDNDCLGVLFVKSGMLRVYMLSEEGRDITLFRVNTGGICILSASCVLSSITFDVHIDAEEYTEALLISAPYFSVLSENNVYVQNFAYKLTADSFSDVMWTMQQILFMSLDKRLAILLWDELSKTGGNTLYLTHEQIARYIGSAREVVSRMLKYFSQEGIVELGRGSIKILDKEKLRLLTE